MQFYPTDWLADTRMLTASAKGVWIDSLAALWNAPERGFLKMPERAWGRLWGVESERIPDLLDELGTVAEIHVEGGSVTIGSRRMIKEEVERERSRNSKKAKERQIWAYRALVSRLFPALFPNDSGEVPEKLPPDSRKPPGEFPENSRPIPGDIPETRNQRIKEREIGRGREPNEMPRSIRRPDLSQAKSAAASMGVSAEMADDWWHAREASEWMKGTAGGGTTPIGSNWQADMKTYASRMAAGNDKGRNSKRGGFAGIQEDISMP